MNGRDMHIFCKIILECEFAASSFIWMIPRNGNIGRGFRRKPEWREKIPQPWDCRASLAMTIRIGLDSRSGREWQVGNGYRTFASQSAQSIHCLVSTIVYELSPVWKAELAFLVNRISGKARDFSVRPSQFSAIMELDSILDGVHGYGDENYWIKFLEIRIQHQKEREQL